MTDLENDYLWDDETQQDEFLEENHEQSEYSKYFEDDDDQNTNTDDDDDDQDGEKPVAKDYLSRLLRSKGIDRERVRIENDEGEIEEWNFDDLDDETKFGILSSDPNNVISDEELATLDFLRKNRMNLKDFASFC